MKLVYLDEAGISAAKQEPYLVVAGVIVDADKQLLRLERRLDEIVAQYIPADKQEGFIFHATELFNGGGKVFDRREPDFPAEKRFQIADELAAIPGEIGLPITFGVTDKANFPTTFKFPDGVSEKEKNRGAHLVAYMSCAIDVEQWMRRNSQDEVCMMIVEDNHEMRQWIKQTQSQHQRPEIVGSLDERAKLYFPFTKIKQDPLFEGKRKSSPLQMADFCAYVIKRFMMDREDARYLRFFDPLRAQIVFNEPPDKAL